MFDLYPDFLDLHYLNIMLSISKFRSFMIDCFIDETGEMPFYAFGDYYTYIISKSFSVPKGWRVSLICPYGPWGHSEFNTYKEAVEDFLIQSSLQLDTIILQKDSPGSNLNAS